MAARRNFEEATGPIREGAADYESRIAHFFEQHLCSVEDGTSPPVARFAELAPGLSASERAQLAGWLRSHRSLFAFEGWDPESRLGLVRDLWLGGSFRVCGRPEDKQPQRRMVTKLVQPSLKQGCHF